MSDQERELQNQEKQEVKAPEGVERLSNSRVYSPRVDIYETGSAIMVVADMPGVEQDCIDVALEKNILTIRGHVASEAPDGYDLSYGEYDVGDFERSFTLSDEVDRDKIEAKLSNGVLAVTLPKASAESRTISVSVSD